MNSAGVFVIALAVLGVSAKPQGSNSFQQNGFKIISGSSVPTVKTHIRTSVVENPTINFPTFIPPTTVTQSCHCLRTIVRPQIRNEIITVPTVDRIVRTVATPIVETVETPLGAFTQQSILSDVNRNGNLGGFQSDFTSLGGSTNGIFGENNAKRFSASHSSNSANEGTLNKSNGVVTQHGFQNGKNFITSTGTIFSGNPSYLNNGQILRF